MANNVVLVNATRVTQSTAPFGADILAAGTVTIDQDAVNPSQVQMLKNLYTAGILTLSSGTWLSDADINARIASFTSRSTFDFAAATIFYATNRTTAGGASSEAFTVTGAATTDMAVAFLNTPGSTPRTILSAKVTSAATVTIIFSGDPSTDHIVTLVVLRPRL